MKTVLYGKFPLHLRDYFIVNLGLKSVCCVFNKTINLLFLEFSTAETLGAENGTLQGFIRLPQNQQVWIRLTAIKFFFIIYFDFIDIPITNQFFSFFVVFFSFRCSVQ